MMIEQICIGLLMAAVILYIFELIATLLHRPYILSLIKDEIIEQREKYYTNKYRGKLLYNIICNKFTYANAVYFDHDYDGYYISGARLNIDHMIILPYKDIVPERTWHTLNQDELQHHDVLVVYRTSDSKSWRDKSTYRHAILRYLPEQSDPSHIKLFDIKTNDIYMYDFFDELNMIVGDRIMMLINSSYIYLPREETIIKPKQQYVINKKKKTTEI